MKSNPDNYIPFGPEWEKAVLRCPKAVIVQMMKKALIELLAFKDAEREAKGLAAIKRMKGGAV